nr:uncharacterized protein LOC113808539 [Penaeus vannamei]
MGGLPPLTGKWRGPARILKRLGPVSFEIQDVTTEVQMKAHLNHLKAYYAPAELSYAADDEVEDDEEVEDSDDDDAEAPNPDDPWVAMLTSMVREAEACGVARELQMLELIYSELFCCNAVSADHSDPRHGRIVKCINYQEGVHSTGVRADTRLCQLVGSEGYRKKGFRLERNMKMGSEPSQANVQE